MKRVSGRRRADSKAETASIRGKPAVKNLASYLESGTPQAIMRHGETLGF